MSQADNYVVQAYTSFIEHCGPLRVKFYTRSANLKLYILAKGLFAFDGIDCVRVVDSTSDSYLYTMLSDTDCDVAINIDEDAFVVDLAAVFKLSEYVISNGYVNCGMPDGGAHVSRSCNPIITNPFFNIMYLKKIRESGISVEKIKSFSYLDHKQQMIDAFNKQNISLPYKYDFDCCSFEPYYPFFFYLAFHFKTLYLPAANHKDGITTILLDNNRHELCYHSWFSRLYGRGYAIVRKNKKENLFHTKRIDALTDEVYSKALKVRPDLSSVSVKAKLRRDTFTRMICKLYYEVLIVCRKLRLNAN